MKADSNRYLWLPTVLLLCASIGFAIATPPDSVRRSNVTSPQLTVDLAAASQGRVLFSHHSVGANIIEGVKRLDAENQKGDHIRVVSLDEAAKAKGPMLIEFSGGQNGDPKGKIDAFAATIRSKPGLKPDLAFMKFCFVDFNPRTDVDGLFSYYQKTIENIEEGTSRDSVRPCHGSFDRATQWP